MASTGGTLVLAIATFTSIRSANRSARVAERSLLAAQRPVLIPSREDDPDELVRFIDDIVFHVSGHGGVAKLKHGSVYLAMALRNGGAGLAVIHSWHVETRLEARSERPQDPDRFRRQTRDLYIPAGTTGFWQGALRDAEDPDYAGVVAAIEDEDRLFIDILYGDHEGGQRTIARFGLDLSARDGSRADVFRYWNIDGEDPRG